jgi:hypothetical protein
VYALDAKTGREVWRLRAAPVEKYIAEEGQFASAWPVIGGVMPLNDNVYFTCGRAVRLEGGIRMFAVEAATGKVRWRKPGGTSGDLFLSDGKDLHLTRVAFRPDTGERVLGAYKAKGLLQTTQYFSPVSVMDYMACVEPALSNKKHIDLTDGRIAGENLAFSEDLGIAAWRYRFGVPAAMMNKSKADERFIYATSGGQNRWLQDEGIRQQMMGVVLAGDAAFLAGVPTALDPREKSELWVCAMADGKRLQTLQLDARPVYDGLSAAGGRLYLTAEDGRVLCLGAK